jgi:hypothetical protein
MFMCLLPEFQRVSQRSDGWLLVCLFSAPLFFLMLIPALMLALTLRYHLNRNGSPRRSAAFSAFLAGFAPGIVGIISGFAGWIFIVVPILLCLAIPLGSYLVLPRYSPGTCFACGSDVSTHKPGDKCPECGTPVEPPQ